MSSNIWSPDGRLARTDYFINVLVCSVLSTFAVMLARAGSFLAFMAILSLILMTWVSVCASTKRLHDLGHSGWWNLIALIPIPNVIFGLYLLFARGQNQDNLYGPSLSAAPGETSVSNGTLNVYESLPTQDVVVVAVDASGPACVVDMPVTSNLDLEPLEKFWAQALQECNEQKMRPGLWAKAFADAQGQESIAKAQYMRSRAVQLQAEHDMLEQMKFAEQQKARQAEEATQLALKAEREAVLAEMTEANALEALKPKGRCPNCSAIINLDADICLHCKADFSSGSAWKIKPLSGRDLQINLAMTRAAHSLKPKDEPEKSVDSVTADTVLVVGCVLLFLLLINIFVG
jgi:uncharacterized membrane protein YhaH (DUF805 family)